MHRLRWLFELRERFSGPAKKIAGALTKIQELFSKIKSQNPAKPAERLGDKLLRLNAGLDILGKVHRTMKSISGITIDIGKGAFDMASGALDKAAFKENTLMAFQQFLGDRSKAEQYFDQLNEFAAKTAFDTTAIMDSAKNLLSKGIKQETVNALLLAMGDLAAVNNMSPEMIKRINAAFGQIAAKEKLTAEELIGQLGEAGLNTGDVYKQLAEWNNVTKKQAMEMASTGKIGVDEGFSAIFESVQKNISKGKLGSFLMAAEGNYSTKKAAVGSRIDELQMGLFGTEGFDLAKNFLGNLGEALNPKGAGMMVQLELIDLFNEMLGFSLADMAGKDGAQKIAQFVVEFIRGIRELVRGIQELFSAIGSILRGLGGGSVTGGLIAVFGKIVGFFVMMLGLLTRAADGVDALVRYFVGDSPQDKKVREDATKIMADEGVSMPFGMGIDLEFAQNIVNAKAKEAEMMAHGAELARAIADGWVVGLLEKSPMVLSMMDLFTGEAPKVVQTGLEIQSPSKVFERFGFQTAAGYSKGLGRAHALVGNAANDNIVAPSIEPMANAGGVASATTNGGKTTVNVTINVNANGSEDLAEKIKDATVEGVTEAFEKLGFEMGAAA